MRLVLFGSGGPLSRAALETLARTFGLIAVVVPASGSTSTLRGRARAVLHWGLRRPFLREAGRLGVPVLTYRAATHHIFEHRLAALAPDLLCVAAFPHLLRRSTFELAACGAINLHPSLLPRHRGPAPLFWTYVADDREAGVTVHWIDEGADTGPVIAQDAILLARGRPVRELYEELAHRGASLLARSVGAVRDGVAERIPQDESRATRAPVPVAGSACIDVGVWGAERVWHVLAGLGGVYHDLLTDADGHTVAHGAALGFRLGARGRPPGAIEAHGRVLRVYCRDGTVDVAPPPLKARALLLARRALQRRTGVDR